MLASAKVSSACLVQLWKKLTHQRRFLREDASFPPQYPLSFRRFTMPGMFGRVRRHSETCPRHPVRYSSHVFCLFSHTDVPSLPFWSKTLAHLHQYTEKITNV